MSRERVPKRRSGWLMWFLLLLATGLVALAYALHTDAIRVPDPWNPWAPISVADEPNWLTSFKLARLSEDSAQCRAVLAEAEMRYDAVPDRETEPGCGFFNAVRIESTTAALEQPFILSCRAAVPLAIWERHVLQPVALLHFGERVAMLEHFGSYACRGVYGRAGGRLSQHATADALDVSGFVLEGGRRIRVLSGWPADDSPEGEFLRELHRGACGIFDGVLGPEYNPAHADHFHLEQGGARMCR